MFTIILSANIGLFVLITIKSIINLYTRRDDIMHTLIVILVSFIGLTSVVHSSIVVYPYAIKEIRTLYEHQNTNSISHNVNDGCLR